ncbi:hypothetical protein MRX96_046866 [Rhipicephalus microplus]
MEFTARRTRCGRGLGKGVQNPTPSKPRRSMVRRRRRKTAHALPRSSDCARRGEPSPRRVRMGLGREIDTGSKARTSMAHDFVAESRKRAGEKKVALKKAP